ncbi:S8 family peptidase [Mucilaginibacter rubeus]|uniref:S8/S53 family peptidase n=1 Tax=Mucilaginibacter rubeus TaxID=2027860 RepID=A0A5C1HVW2_9SPHI|nr:S8/S53 family peptidase [Mucilaginibacter rubeus]QEM10012.1 S8/S53 family peptidase [Mucilaginibacter rubeus]
MKLTVKDNYLNVRAGRPSVNAPSDRYLEPGDEVEVDDTAYPGDAYDGIGTWFRDKANNYYWSGGFQTTDLTDKQSFSWFDELKIKDLWDTYGEYGSLATVAVLDTGYDIGNTDLAPAVTDSDILIDYASTIMDKSHDLHGTHCSSLIAARNTLHWYIGVAPQCRLLCGKISSGGELRNFNSIISGIKWAIGKGADIISVSYGSPLNDTDKTNFQSQLNQLLVDKNVLMFAASGNNFAGGVISQDLYPASFSNFVSVGATDANGQLSDITVRSEHTIIHSRGTDIESYGTASTPAAQSGTSFSTPIIAAIAALGVSACKKKTGNWDAAKLLSALYNSGSDLNGFQGKKVIDPANFFEILINT